MSMFTRQDIESYFHTSFKNGMEKVGFRVELVSISRIKKVQPPMWAVDYIRYTGTAIGYHDRLLLIQDKWVSGSVHLASPEEMLLPEQIDQAKALGLIEQALAALDGEYQAGSKEVQAWLRTNHNVDLPIDEVSDGIKIVRRTAED